MKATKQQKVLLSVLVLGMLFLTVDFLRATPSPAIETVEPVLASASVGAPAVSQEAERSSVANRLNAIQARSGTNITDAFGLQQLLDGATATQFTQDLQKNWKLTAVLISGSRPQAVINGTIVRVGQSFDGYKLVAVGSNSARLVSRSRSVTLEMR